MSELIAWFYAHCGRYNDIEGKEEAARTEIRTQNWAAFEKGKKEAKITTVQAAYRIVQRYKRNGFRLRHPDDKHDDFIRRGRPFSKLDSIKGFLSERANEW